MRFGTLVVREIWVVVFERSHRVDSTGVVAGTGREMGHHDLPLL